MILVYKATLRTEAPFEEVTLFRSEHLQKLLKSTSYSILYIMVCGTEVILPALLTHKFVYTFNFLSVNSVSCFAIQQSVISKDMKIKLHLEGTVNGHAFTIKGEGEGNPHE